MSTLRVIAGKAKGRRLQTVPGDTTRPITDRTKESLFNILGGDVTGSIWLDLFAGTGAVGIEALSRGAKAVLFNELNNRAIAVIRKNLETTQLTEGAEVRRMDAFTLLVQSPDRTFDYIYIAPPQYKEMWKQALMAVDQKPGWLATAGWVIVQIHPVEFGEITLQNLKQFDQRKYGSTLLVFYQI